MSPIIENQDDSRTVIEHRRYLPAHLEEGALDARPVGDVQLPARLGVGALNATYALITSVAPTTLDGGNATSSYTGSFNFDGGSAA